MRYNHGLKNRNLAPIFRQNIVYRSVSIWYSPSIINSQEYHQRIGKIADISAKYRWSTNKSVINHEWWMRGVVKGVQKLPIFSIYRWFFQKIGDISPIKLRLIGDFLFFIFILKFDMTAIFDFLMIWRPRFHTCICKGIQWSDLLSNSGKSIFTWSNDYEVFPTVIWRSNGQIWTKIWSNS